MELILILGPMKSGKTHELIGYFAPLKYSKTTFALYHPLKNVRDKTIWSRNGTKLKAKKIKSLAEIADEKAEVVGIDEVHMFDEGVESIEKLLKNGTKVIVSGLDMDHQTRLMPIVQKLLELGPNKVIYKRAVCERCKNTDAVFTQILKDGKPIPPAMPPSIPDDGTYEYVPVCRDCYIRVKD